MQLRLVRSQRDPDVTIGELYVDGEFECFILEDAVRPVKIPGQTAIPRGRYGIQISWSPRFGRPLPLLEHVPNYSGVRIHPGNYPSDTEGCLLPGTRHDGKAVYESRVAFENLYIKITKAIDDGQEVWITIEEPEPDELTASTMHSPRADA
jgi:hypothetical protein